ncbi:MAG: LemA family protein [Treponema sp.]|jgi:LemA protein|nr:LemA family protein [Treponema sp.]
MKRMEKEMTMPTTIIVITAAGGIIAVETIFLLISAKRRLAELDENTGKAMLQIGEQLSAGFEMLIALLETTKEYAGQKIITLIESIKTERCAITGKSTPKDIRHQGDIITKTLGILELVSGAYPELKTNENYIKQLAAVETFENMLRSSRQIYNNSVAKLNDEIHRFPFSIVAATLQFSERNYI